MKLNRKAGFTLLEVILAMAMAATLVLTLHAGMNIALRARRQTAELTTAVRTATIAMEMLSHDLESVALPGDHLAGPFLVIADPGAAASLDFFAVSTEPSAQPGEAPVEGIHHVMLAVRPDPVPPALVRRTVENLLAPIEKAPREEILCRGVRSLTFSCYDGSDWKDSWDSSVEESSVPLAVRITLELDDPSSASGILAMTRIIPISVKAPPTATADAGGAP